MDRPVVLFLFSPPFQLSALLTASAAPADKPMYHLICIPPTSEYSAWSGNLTNSASASNFFFAARSALLDREETPA